MADVWTAEMGANLVEAFRRLGPQWKPVAREVGMDWRRVKRAYEKGVRPSKRTGFPGLEPIQSILAREQVEARAALVELNALPPAPEPATLEAMRDQVLRARVQTGRVLEELKGASTTIAPGLRELAAGARALCGEVGRRLVDLTVVLRDADGDDQITLASAMFTLKDVTQVLNEATTTLKLLTDMERRELGEPTEIHGLAIHMTDDEAFERIKEAKEVFDHLDVDALEPPPLED